MLQGVIFDIDGTLLDSNGAHAQSWVDTFAEAGYDVPFEAVRPLIGMGADKLLPKTIGIRHDSEEGKKLSKRRSEIFRKKYLPIFALSMAASSGGPADLLAHYGSSLIGREKHPRHERWPVA